jgi:hypothetical protein
VCDRTAKRGQSKPKEGNENLNAVSRVLLVRAYGKLPWLEQPVPKMLARSLLAGRHEQDDVPK